MRIIFGLGLDSHRGPSSENSFNSPTVGPLGLLDLLETYLGLARPRVSAARRVTAYLGHLRQHDDGGRFYSASLHADSVGTAAKLLGWRDELRLGGWNGSSFDDSPRRIQELAQVERTAHGDIAPGQAERLAAVEYKLATERTPIDSVVLVDPLETFPLAWRRVLTLLPAVAEWEAQPHGHGELRALQELAGRAVYEGKLPGILPAASDGTVTLVQATSRATAEHWLSAKLAHEETDRLIVCESLGDAVDATLVATGSLSCGFESPSELRPAMQALGLALETVWTPIDTGRLVEFLLHPIGPFSRSARRTLAKAIGEQPGIGGEAWSDAKRAIAAAENGKTTVDDIAFWLEGERWTRDAGVPIDALAVRVDKLLEALKRRLTGDATLAAIYAPAVEQCRAVLDGLAEFKRQGIPSLLPRHVEQLILHASPMGSNPSATAQIGCMRSAPSADVCIEPADEVIWWMPSTPVLPQSLPWTAAEVLALKTLGVELRDPQRELSELARQWLRPLLAARKHFVLVLPPPGAEEHPFRQLIQKLVANLRERSINLDTEVNGTYVGTLAAPLARLAFPETPRIIELKAPIELPQHPQSYTSLTELFNHPALYAIKRVARLHPNAVITTEEDNRLLGTLAHRVFENFFAHADALAWTNQHALDWFRANIDVLLLTEGAPLLMQGAGVSQQRFKSICESALISLLDHLRSAGAISVRTEVAFEGVLGNVPLTGNVDLIVELQGKQTIALDMKWRDDKRYSAILTDGRHLQLALYSALIEQNEGAPPVAVGYFIVESGSLFITRADIVPTAQVRIPRNGITVNELLQQARESWAWRASQWDAGQIDVVVDEILDDAQGPDGTLPVEGVGPWHFDHLVLLGGWEQ
ncbi:PD-(D/E)XK nuclease family protein [Paraburkholderia caribensis]|uniref:PD-(D/E)XK nuclease family protein n=1 Tax=Paraburkholderia caribensis TaxID=75105 RepID=UPI0031E07A36